MKMICKSILPAFLFLLSYTTTAEVDVACPDLADERTYMSPGEGINKEANWNPVMPCMDVRLKLFCLYMWCPYIYPIFFHFSDGQVLGSQLSRAMVGDCT